MYGQIAAYVTGDGVRTGCVECGITMLLAERLPVLPRSVRPDNRRDAENLTEINDVGWSRWFAAEL